MEATTTLSVSRGTMSGARMIGECLAQQEGVRCLTREDLAALFHARRINRLA